MNQFQIVLVVYKILSPLHVLHDLHSMPIFCLLYITWEKLLVCAECRSGKILHLQQAKGRLICLWVAIFCILLRVRIKLIAAAVS